jgi:TonB family protein
VALSFLAHAGIIGMMGTVSYRHVVAPVHPKTPIRYVTLAPPPVPPDTPAPEPPRPAPVAPEPAIEPPRAAPLARVVVPPPEPAPPRPDPVPSPAPAPPPARDVSLGLFERAAAAASGRPPRQVQETGFDAAPATAAAPARSAAALTGLFDPDRAARPGTDRPRGVVAGSGFDEKTAAASPAPSPARGVASAGFETGAVRQPHARPAAVVERTGFGDVVAAPAPARGAAPAAPARTSVEVLSKPAPGYTDEARARRIEGEVLLDVLFAASGEVRVIRVVRGLGFGLDEMAARAASGMRFKPATENGRPVDVQATVHIVFRLS